MHGWPYCRGLIRRCQHVNHKVSLLYNWFTWLSSLQQNWRRRQIGMHKLYDEHDILLPFFFLILGVLNLFWLLMNIGSTSLSQNIFPSVSCAEHLRLILWHSTDYASVFTRFASDRCLLSGIDSSTPGQNSRHFTDDVFRCLLWMWMKSFVIWFKFQWKPLSERMFTRSIDSYMQH